MKCGLRRLACNAPIVLMFSASIAHAECRQKLAEVDAQLAAADMDGIALQQFNMIRDQAEMFCKQGQEAMAMQFLNGMQQELPNPGGAEATGTRTATASNKSELSNGYLAGTWCAIVTQEQAQITFFADGTYSACFHDSVQGRFGHCSSAQQTDDWLANFKQAHAVNADEFALGNSARSTTYRRGDCRKHGI